MPRRKTEEFTSRPEKRPGELFAAPASTSCEGACALRLTAHTFRPHAQAGLLTGRIAAHLMSSPSERRREKPACTCSARLCIWPVC